MRLPLHFMPGTTQTVEIELIVDGSELAAAWVTFVQGSDIKVNKELKDCQWEGKILYVPLTQEDTLKLENSTPGRVQFRGRLAENQLAIESEPEAFSVGECLKREVI